MNAPSIHPSAWDDGLCGLLLLRHSHLQKGWYNLDHASRGDLRGREGIRGTEGLLTRLYIMCMLPPAPPPLVLSTINKHSGGVDGITPVIRLPADAVRRYHCDALHLARRRQYTHAALCGMLRAYSGRWFFSQPHLPFPPLGRNQPTGLNDALSARVRR